MISNQTTFDTQALRDFITQHGLDPVPKSDPRQFLHRGVRLIVEEYQWGRVFFAEDRKHSSGLTWIEKTGRDVAVPGWAQEIRARVDRPQCLGFHEDDHVCDGGENPVTGEIEKACRWRKVCLEVQNIADTPEGIVKALKNYTDADLWEKIEPAPKMWHTDRRQRGLENLQERRAENFAGSVEFIGRYVDDAAERCRAFIATARHRTGVGDWFLNSPDNTPTSKRLLFRRRLISGTRTTEQSMACFYPKKVEAYFTIEINTGEIGVATEIAPQCAPKPVKNNGRDAVRLTVDGESYDAALNFFVYVYENELFTSYGIGAKRPMETRIHNRRDR